MQGMSTAESLGVVYELATLEPHFVVGSDYVEFGSHWPDMLSAAGLMSPLLWFPAASVKNRTFAGHQEVTPCRLRAVKRGILPNGRVFCKFQLASPGRTGADMREMFILYKTGSMKLDRRHEGSLQKNLATLVAHYLNAKNAARTKTPDTTTDAAGQETIKIGFAQEDAHGHHV